MSRFVSAGTVEEPVERDEEWVKAQQELEANRRRKEEESRQQVGKSLYDVLQANKAAKQDAFEESIRLKNQFRSLDNDEVDFLDSVLESTRAKEAAIRKETDEQLDLFRRQREEAERAARAEERPGEDIAEGTQWLSGPRKKRKAVEKEALKGVKIRRVSSTDAEKPTDAPNSVPTMSSSRPDSGASPTKPPKDQIKASQMPPLAAAPQNDTKITPRAKAGPAPALGLGAYSSDED